MLRSSTIYQTYLRILEAELIPATGCTEPISIAYGAAKAREVLGIRPSRVKIEVSRNILKNALSVVVPNTHNLRGIKAAVAAGIIAGKSEKILGCLQDVEESEIELIKNCEQFCKIDVEFINSTCILDILITAYSDDSYSKVRIMNYHTNIVLIEKNGEVLFTKPYSEEDESYNEQRSLLNVKDILHFAETVELEAVTPLLERQIECNTKISEVGLKENFGANIGKTLLKMDGNDLKTRAKAKAAAASDARMGGCTLPVVICSGSGNQGITLSIPVIEYAKSMNVSQEKLYRALIVANLITIHLKTGIGRLSAYCGVVSAGTGAAAGIAYLHGYSEREIARTITNSLAILSGMICDGAKASCAAKIASSVEAGIMAFQMVQNQQSFDPGEGIVSADVEHTIANVARLASQGMKETDVEIVKMMIENI